MMSNGQQQRGALSNSDDVCPVCHGLPWALIPVPLPPIYARLEGTEFALDYREAAVCPSCGGYLRHKSASARSRSYLPDSFKAARLKDFDWGAYPSDTSIIKRVVLDFVDGFEAWREHGLSPYLVSETRGSGKTFLASCIAGELIEKYHVSVKFLSVSRLLDAAEAEREGESRMIEELCNADVAILDDLGQKKTGSAYLDDVLFKIIDQRYQAKRPILVTSNLSVLDLQTDSRTVDRLAAMTQEIKLPEFSVRQKQSLERKTAFFKKRGLLN